MINCYRCQYCIRKKNYRREFISQLKIKQKQYQAGVNEGEALTVISSANSKKPGFSLGNKSFKSEMFIVNKNYLKSY